MEFCSELDFDRSVLEVKLTDFGSAEIGTFLTTESLVELQKGANVRVGALYS